MEGGLLERGAVIVADNTLYPGCPEYLEYVRGSDKFQSEHFLSKLEYTDREDGLERSVYLGGVWTVFFVGVSLMKISYSCN